MNDVKQRRQAGLICLSVAVLIVLTNLIGKSVPAENEWMILAAAALFFLCGIQLLTGVKGRLSYLLGGTVCALFAALGFYFAFTNRTLSGGVPLIPAAWNQTISHLLFGFGAVIAAGLAVYFLTKAIRPARSGSVQKPAN